MNEELHMMASELYSSLGKGILELPDAETMFSKAQRWLAIMSPVREAFEADDCVFSFNVAKRIDRDLEEKKSITELVEYNLCVFENALAERKPS